MGAAGQGFQQVAPLVGAWIEIEKSICDKYDEMSLLSWERGLKLMELDEKFCDVIVAPLVGAWIEIRERIPRQQGRVAPLVGAWIEMHFVTPSPIHQGSRSSRGSVD